MKPSHAPPVEQPGRPRGGAALPCQQSKSVLLGVAGTDGDDSDLDLLVDPSPETTLFDLGGLQVELEVLLGVPVMLTPAICRPGSGRRSLAEARGRCDD